MPRTLLRAAVAAAATVAVPSVAHGATLHPDGLTPHRILFRDESGETNLVSLEGTRSVVIHVVGSQFADVLAGSPSTVRIAGVDGDDRITGGSGAEILSGGDGNDRIDARDGAPDTVDCGGQALDRAAVDVDAETSITGCAQVIS